MLISIRCVRERQGDNHSTIITLGARNFNDISIHENDRRFSDLHAIQFDPIHGEILARDNDSAITGMYARIKTGRSSEQFST